MEQESNLLMSQERSTTEFSVFAHLPTSLHSRLFHPSRSLPAVTNKNNTVHTHIFSDLAGGQGLEPLKSNNLNLTNQFILCRHPINQKRHSCF